MNLKIRPVYIQEDVEAIAAKVRLAKRLLRRHSIKSTNPDKRPREQASIGIVILVLLIT